MKKKLLLLLMIIPILTFGQIIDDLPKDENGNLYYSDVVQVDNLKKEDLYLRAKQFFVDVFKSANDVIQMDDKESGIIIGKGFNDIYIKVMGLSTPIQMWYSIKIQSRDERYKYEIYDIYFKSYPGDYGVITTRSEVMFSEKNYYKKNGKPRDVQEKYKIETVNKVNNLVIKIQDIMNKPTSSTDKNDDW